MFKNIIISLLFLWSLIHAQTNTYYNVRDFGASGEGRKLDTKAIQNAVDICSEKGGTILFPPGKYLTGSIELKSNIDIYIQNGAEILGSTNISDYFERKPKLDSYNDAFLKHSLFYAEGKINITIHGEGIINGQGGAYKVTTRVKPDRYKNRPFVFRFIECKNVHVENITMTNSAMWMQQYLVCEDLYIKGIKVFNHANQNNDMMDIDGCKNVIISDCLGDTDDDGITLKSTSPRITENVSITNCVLSSHCNAFKFGTESTGGFRNITVSNIVIKPSAKETVIYGLPKGTSGITLATVDGGILENINISNVVMTGPEVPIFLRLGNRARKYNENVQKPGVGIYRNVVLDNIIANDVGKTGCSISGIPNYKVEDITLNNIHISFRGGGKNVKEIKDIAELEDSYPEGTMWEELPAYGLFIRHVQNLKLFNVELYFENPDERPAVIIDDADGIKINSLIAESAGEKSDVIEISRGRNIYISESGINGKANNFLAVQDEETEKIFLINNDLSGCEKSLSQKKKGQIKVISELNP